MSLTQEQIDLLTKTQEPLPEMAQGERLTFEHDGTLYAEFTEAAALLKGVPQAVIDAAKHAKTIDAVKAEAGRIIVEAVPEWKQRNLIARATELNEILATGGSLDAGQQSELDAIKACWAEIKAVRNYSDTLEADVLADNNPDILAGWPTVSAP